MLGLHRLESLSDAQVHGLSRLGAGTFVSVGVEVGLDLLFGDVFLFSDDIGQVEDFNAVGIEHSGHFLFVGPNQLGEYLVEHLFFILWNEAVLDLEEHIRGGLNDLVLNLNELCIALG